MAPKLPTDDGKKAPAKPGKGFDPKAEDWQNKGRRQFANPKPQSRPFKGGGRGR